MTELRAGALLADRYRLAANLATAAIVPARDELLEREVDVVLLDPIDDELTRAKALREFRRTLRKAGDRVADVEDTGEAGDSPFLVVSASGRMPDLVAPVEAGVAARVSLDVLSGLDTLRSAGLGWLPVRPERLRRDATGRAQVLPAPTESVASETEIVVAVGALLTRLIGSASPVKALREVAGRAMGTAKKPVTTVPELRALLLEHVSDASGESNPLPAVTTETPEPATVSVEPAVVTPETDTTVVTPPAAVPPVDEPKVEAEKVSTPDVAPTPTVVEAPAVDEVDDSRTVDVSPELTAPRRTPISLPEPGEVRVPVLSTQPDPAFAPRYVSLSSLVPQESEYVPLSALLREADEPIEKPMAVKSPASRARGLFHRRHRDSESQPHAS